VTGIDGARANHGAAAAAGTRRGRTLQHRIDSRYGLYRLEEQDEEGIQSDRQIGLHKRPAANR